MENQQQPRPGPEQELLDVIVGKWINEGHTVAHTLAYDAAFVQGTQGGRPLPTGRWDSVRMPTLVVDGGASPAWVRNGARAIADLLPDARRSTLEGQTHEVAPEVLAPVLAEFFAN